MFRLVTLTVTIFADVWMARFEYCILLTSRCTICTGLARLTVFAINSRTVSTCNTFLFVLAFCKKEEILYETPLSSMTVLSDLYCLEPPLYPPLASRIRFSALHSRQGWLYLLFFSSFFFFCVFLFYFCLALIILWWFYVLFSQECSGFSFALCGFFLWHNRMYHVF